MFKFVLNQVIGIWFLIVFTGVCIQTRGEMAMAQTTSDFYQISVKSLEGKEVSLKQYQGKVLLIVNTASQCGFTKQYKGLEAIYAKYKAQGLVVLGMPCNQFGAQEPGTAEEIQHFCELNYKVQFPLLAKADVKGSKQHPLYQHLIAHSGNHNDVKWNFEKFLVGRDGAVQGRFLSAIEPESKELVSAIESALNNK